MTTSGFKRNKKKKQRSLHPPPAPLISFFFPPSRSPKTQFHQTMPPKSRKAAAKKPSPRSKNETPAMPEVDEEIAQVAAVEEAKVPKSTSEGATATDDKLVKEEEETVVEETVSLKNEEDTDLEEEEPDEEDPEEAVEEEDDSDGEDEGNQQVVEEGAREGEVESISGDDEDNKEDDPAIYMQPPLTERKKQKEYDIFIGGLDKEAVEDDLIQVFGVFGEIQSVRIVKHPITQKSKGFAFIHYASIEHAKKALVELKDGAEVKGKKVRVSASQDNDTLYLGNICKTWNRDHVLEMLKGYGVEHIEDIVLPDDPKSEGNIRGFAFLEFKSHDDAKTSFQRLRQPDAVFGCDVSAKVSFAQAPLHPCEEDLLKVKTVYMDGIPKSWDEAKVEDLCKKYGEIEKIQLSRNFPSSKKKDFGFIEFSSRDSALACVEGINSTHIEGDVNVKANLAKPMYKRRLAKQKRGGFKVQKDGETTDETVISKKKKKAKSKPVNDNKKTQQNLKSLNRNTPHKAQNKILKDTKVSQTVKSSKGEKRGRKVMDTPAVTNQQPSKKARTNHNYGKRHGKSSTDFTNTRISYSTNPYIPRQSAYAPPATSHPAYMYPRASVSQHRRTDLEPHAGCIPPAKPVWDPYEDAARRAGTYYPRSSSGYARGYKDSSSYPGYSNYAGYQADYAHPSGGADAYGRPYY